MVVVRRRRRSFSISSGGVLSFESDPNFEAPADANRDNVYEVTAQASDGVNTGTLDITVTIGNEEEPGEVTLSNLQPGGRCGDHRHAGRPRRGCQKQC